MPSSPRSSHMVPAFSSSHGSSPSYHGASTANHVDGSHLYIPNDGYSPQALKALPSMHSMTPVQRPQSLDSISSPSIAPPPSTSSFVETPSIPMLVPSATRMVPPMAARAAPGDPHPAQAFNPVTNIDPAAPLPLLDPSGLSEFLDSTAASLVSSLDPGSLQQLFG